MRAVNRLVSFNALRALLVGVACLLPVLRLQACIRPALAQLELTIAAAVRLECVEHRVVGLRLAVGPARRVLDLLDSRVRIPEVGRPPEVASDGLPRHHHPFATIRLARVQLDAVDGPVWPRDCAIPRMVRSDRVEPKAATTCRAVEQSRAVSCLNTAPSHGRVWTIDRLVSFDALRSLLVGVARLLPVLWGEIGTGPALP